ncbi:MAG: alanine racemase [Phycisphaerae bacterium]|nr:MAG: alanine racemase [Phycisphaerae bacterium]
MADTHRQDTPIPAHRQGAPNLRRRNAATPTVSEPGDVSRSRQSADHRVAHLIAEIDLAAVHHNIGVLRSYTAPVCRFCVAVKANAYGHGLEVILPALAEARVDMIAVATVTEARQARSLGWRLPILLLGTELSIYHGSLKQDVAEWLVGNEIRITVLSRDDLDVITKAADAVQMPAMIHLKLDSGLSRMGVDETSLIDLIDRASENPRVVIDGLYTHFASADEPGCAFASMQLQRFQRFVESVRGRFDKMPTIHTANSAAVVNMPGSHFDMVRPGIGIYGYQTTTNSAPRVDLKPAMRVVSSIMLVKQVPKGSEVGYGRSYQTKRDSILGVIPIGYADGLDRRLSNTGFVTVQDRSAPIVGKISMDQTIVDLTEIANQENIAAGCQAVVIETNNQAPNSVESMARQLDTIPYEIVTSISPRVVRLAQRA